MTRATSLPVSCSVPAVPRTTGKLPVAETWALLPTMVQVWAERRRLQRLDARSLRDLGLSQVEVEREASRSFFDLPANRR
jgi:uncharacterized protein YjiS (DUF1127 family)